MSTSQFYDNDDIEALIASERANRVLKLASDKQLGYSDFGSDDPGAFPVIFMGGVSTHRYFGVFCHAMARRRGLRFITIERPGTGLSQPLTKAEEQARVRNVAAMMEEAIKLLGISRYALLAQCFGSVIGGIVVSATEPGAVVSVQLVSPWLAPSQPGTKGFFRFARGLPAWSVNGAMSLAGAMQKSVFTSPKGMRTVAKGVADDERAIWEDPRTLQVYQATLQKSKTEYSNGWIQDSKAAIEMAAFGSIDFYWTQLTNVVDIYIGDDDGLVPLKAASAAAEGMKNLRHFDVKAKGTHSLIFDAGVMATVLDRICSDRDAAAQAGDEAAAAKEEGDARI